MHSLARARSAPPAPRLNSSLAPPGVLVPATGGARVYAAPMHTGDTVQLVVHVWRGQLAWTLFVTPPRKAKYVAARGMCERASEPHEDRYGHSLVLAAYEAYRAVGE